MKETSLRISGEEEKMENGDKVKMRKFWMRTAPSIGVLFEYIDINSGFIWNALMNGTREKDEVECDTHHSKNQNESDARVQYPRRSLTRLTSEW